MGPPKSTAPTIPYIDPDNPQWESSPITLGIWFYSLEDYLFDLDKRYRTLVEKGYIVTSKSVVTASLHHSVILCHNLDKEPFSFEKPAPVDPVAALLASDPRSAASITTFVDDDGKLKDPNGSRYTVMPEAIREVDEAMLGSILATVPDTESKKWIKQ